MERSAANARPPTRRKPLGDAIHRANINAISSSHGKRKPSLSSPSQLPHNESFVPNGTLTVHQGFDSVPSNDNKRSSVMSKEEQPDSKRNSAISNTSTNASNTPRRRKTHIGPWHLGRTIGKGGCSRVRLVQHVQTGQKGAAKIISKQDAEKARAVSMANLVKQAQYDPTLEGGSIMPFGLEREIVIMKLLNHRNIVRLYDVWENRNELYLIMEYVEGGELFDFIQNYPLIEERYVVYLFRQIIAALLYCHRIHIHHRDLKPENILIDHETMQIKLVDFGMAALQPKGKYLSTPCGSPHYAAPELLAFKSYDGGKADVWSCGVILYVMLTGTPPFNFPPDPHGTMREDKKLGILFQKIREADYIMPNNISREARDLLFRIFQADPRQRIDIEGIWNHRFLHLYDKEFDLDPRLESWIGPKPKIEDWKRVRRQDVDREILRNMRTLWHSEKEEVLIERLTSPEANHEKYFYSALLKHREDHLENYAGHPSMAYSASDYQHAKALRGPEEVPPLPGQVTVRSKSQYSILNNEHLHSAHSFCDPPASDTSYDPFRASRNPLIGGSKNYMNVTVHGGGSSASRGLRPSSIHASQRGSAPLRVEALRRGSRISSRMSDTSASSLQRSSTNRLSVTRQGASRSSLGSAVWASSPPIAAVKPNVLHKRAVNFSHLRRSSTASALTLRSQENVPSLATSPNSRRSSKRKLNEMNTNLTALPSSPATKPQLAVRSRKENAVDGPPRLRYRRALDPHQILDSEARKVSAELEKVCQEAFFRSSVSTSTKSSVTDRRMDYLDTPPSSVSRHTPPILNKAVALDSAVISDRPLPPLPSLTETPKTFTARELTETRKRIANRFAEGQGDSADYFKDVLAHLDSLLPSPSRGADGQRAASAPQPASKSLDDGGYLPVISEEGRFADAEDAITHHDATSSRVTARTFTEPVGFRPEGRIEYYTRDLNTIRLVDPSSPTPIAPLNIRKQSGASNVIRKPVLGDPMKGQDVTIRRRNNAQAFAIFEDPTNEEDDWPPSTPTATATLSPELPKAKKRGWFKKTISGPKEHEMQETSKIRKITQKSLSQWQHLDDRIKAHPLHPIHHRQRPSEVTNSDVSEFPLRTPGSESLETPVKDEEGVKRGLWRLFKKRANNQSKTEAKVDRGLRLGSAADMSSSSLGQGYDIPTHSLATPNAKIMAPDAQPANWLAKFLHIKPANRILCFQVGRGRVRQELVRLLREWRRFGVRDVNFDRVTNIINFRIDKKNRLRMKPVSVVVELFVVLEHGRRAQLALARFTQTQGAASSFRRTIEELEAKLDGKGLLVEDEDRKAAMAEILA